MRRSKTDQLGEGADVAIPFGSQPEACPVRALEAWREASGVEEGALFRAVDRHGRVGGRLDGRDVARTLKELAARRRQDAQGAGSATSPGRSRSWQRDVARTLKELAARAGIASALVSGHSLRAGLATTAALAGRSDRAIMAQGRWKSRTMVDRYVRTADAWRENAAAGLL